MALLIMCCFDTEENGRSEYTERTLTNLWHTIDLKRHRLVVIDNGSCERTKDILKYNRWLTTITNDTNIGTAKGVNQGIKLREPGEYVIKLDNDVEWHTHEWVDMMEDAMRRMPELGVLGCKRKDLLQSPSSPDWPSELVGVPHEAGQRWLYVETCDDVMGTCTMLSPRLLDAVGGYVQVPGSVYAFDDTLLNLRSRLAGFTNAFICGVEIDHIDTGANPYTQEKHKLAAEAWDGYHEMHREFIEGTRNLFVEI